MPPHAESLPSAVARADKRSTNTCRGLRFSEAHRGSKRVRASARQFLIDLPPAVAAPLRQPSGSPGQPAEGRPGS